MSEQKLPIKLLCNCGTFDLPHIPSILCGEFAETDQASYDTWLKNQEEHRTNLRITIRYENKLLKRINKDTILDYVQENFFDEIHELVVESHVN